MGDNSREYEWSIDTSGKLLDVIEAVKKAEPLPYPKWVRDAQGVLLQVEIAPSAEDKRDFDRARAALLAELADVKTPFVGVFAGYRLNRQALGGYRMDISVSALERWE